jgi:hypothetical protein
VLSLHGMNTHQRRIIKRALKQAGLEFRKAETVVTNPTENPVSPEHRVLPKEWLLWLWAAALAIALFILAPKLEGNRAFAALCLFIFAFLLIFPLRHLPWILNATGKKRAQRAGIAITLCLALAGLLGWGAWPDASKKTDFSISDPRSIINMKRNFQDTSPLWARYASGYGDTISPVAVAAWIDITNNLDVLETVKDYSVAINTQQCGWVYLTPIRMRSTSFFFIGTGQIQRALPLDFTTDGLDYILERPISPHGTVSGWLMFDTQVKCNVINGESIQYRVSFSTFSGKSLDIVTEFRQLRNDMLIPGSSHANMTGPIFINKPGVADLSKCYVRFYSDEVK